MGASNFYSHAVLPVYAVMNDDLLPYDQFCDKLAEKYNMEVR